MFPIGIALNIQENTLYVTNQRRHTISKITETGLYIAIICLFPCLFYCSGTVHLFAGSRDGLKGLPYDLHGTDARFNSPTGVAIDHSGIIYVADTNNHVIRKITPKGFCWMERWILL